MRAPLAAPALAALVLAAAGCGDGDGDGDIDGSSLRGCLTGEGLRIEPPGLGGSAGLGNVSPDFRATTPDGTAVDFVVEGTPEKAERAAADIAAARAGLGAGGSMLTERNAIAVFDTEPGEQSRAAVERCLGAED